MKMKNLIKSLSKQNINTVRIELARAHLIIALMSFVTIILFSIGSMFDEPIALNLTLSSIAFLCLLAMIIISTITAYGLLSITKGKK